MFEKIWYEWGGVAWAIILLVISIFAGLIGLAYEIIQLHIRLSTYGIP